MSSIEFQTDVTYAAQLLRSVKESKRRISEMKSLIYSGESNIQRNEQKINELQNNFLKNIFKKAAVQSEIKELQTSIKNSLESIKRYKEIVAVENNDIPEAERKLESLKNNIPARFFKLEVLEILDEYFGRDIEGTTIEDAIYYIDSNYSHLMFDEGGNPSYATQPYGSQKSFDSSQPTDVDSNQILRQMEEREAENRREKELWDKEFEEKQREEWEFNAREARRSGKDRDVVKHYDDLLGRTASERELEDRQWDYSKDVENRGATIS